MPTFNPWVIVWALVAMILSITGGYLWGSSATTDSIEAQQARDAKVVAMVQEASQQGAATAIAGIEVKNVTIRQQVERETRTVTDYSNCHHSDDGLLNVNAALTNSEPPSGGELPKVNSAR